MRPRTLVNLRKGLVWYLRQIYIYIYMRTMHPRAYKLPATLQDEGTNLIVLSTQVEFVLITMSMLVTMASCPTLARAKRRRAKQ